MMKQRYYLFKLLIPITLTFGVLVLLFRVGMAGSHAINQAVPSADCSNGNVPAYIETDMTLSGELFTTSNVVVRAGATLTLTPGTHVTMCGEYQLQVNEGGLVAVGTEGQPIVFDADNPAVKWRRISIGIRFLDNTVLQHVVLNNGGGNDPNVIEGALHINDYYGTELPVPVVDHVTINDSGSYGIFVETDSREATPPPLNNLSINNSARAPIIMNASAVGGLGRGNSFAGNQTQTVQVGRFHTGLSGHGLVYQSQIWRNQGIPYEITGPIVLRDADQAGEPTVLTVEPGVNFLMHPDVGFAIGTLGNSNTALIVDGTAEQPVTFTPLDETTNEPWGNIHFGLDSGVATESRLSNAILHYGGGATPGDHRGVLEKEGYGTLRLDQVEIKYSVNGAVYSNNGSLEITNSLLEANREGVRIRNSFATLRNNVIQNNAQGGLINETPGDICIDAMGNYWGDESGPADDSNALDACNLTKTNGGMGDSVSDGVLYSPWLTSVEGIKLQDRSSISPDRFWMVADGIDEAELTITVLDSQGNPLPNKEIILETTRGTLQQPTEPTNSSGITKAHISSTESGGATITAYNATDDQPLSALAALFFWQGGENTGGLIDLSGAPYTFPELIVEGKPYQEGYPITFRLPMQNANPNPVEVKVTYAASGLNIGGSFAAVDVVSKTLQPGESWDALGGWIPTVTGHSCVRATVEVTPLSPVYQSGLRSTLGGSTFRSQQNLNFKGGGFPQPPPCLFECWPIPDFPNPLSPVPAWVDVAVYFYKMHNKAKAANDYINAALGGDPPVHGYEEIATVTEFTPPIITPEGEMTQAQADALNAFDQANAQAMGLWLAIQESMDRYAGASEAEAWDFAAMQRQALEGFLLDYSQALKAQADAIDALLLVTEEAGLSDITFTPTDFYAEFVRLDDEGFNQEELDYYHAFGLSDAEIEAIRLNIVESLGEGGFQTTSFYELLNAYRDYFREVAQDMEKTYGGLRRSNEAARGADGGSPDFWAVGAMQATFAVGNPKDTRETVTLMVRPVEVPLNWTYSLDNAAPTLDPGEIISVTLTINPTDTMVEGRFVRLAVEGFIGDEYIGGILFKRGAPASGSTVFLPLIRR